MGKRRPSIKGMCRRCPSSVRVRVHLSFVRVSTCSRQESVYKMCGALEAV